MAVFRSSARIKEHCWTSQQWHLQVGYIIPDRRHDPRTEQGVPRNREFAFRFPCVAHAVGVGTSALRCESRTKKRSQRSAPLHEITSHGCNRSFTVAYKVLRLCRLLNSLPHNAPFVRADESAIKSSIRRVDTTIGTMVTERTSRVNEYFIDRIAMPLSL
jgi:hypothetical protein